MASRDRGKASRADSNSLLKSGPGSLDLKSFRIFVAVAEAGGFRKASQFHGILQSVLSRKVRELEDQLGVSLFERHRDGVRLTHAGRQFLDDIRAVFGQIERATSSLQAAGAGGEGHLGVGIAGSMSAGFPHLLMSAWRQQHSHVRVTVRDGSPGELVTAVVQRELDVTFVTGSVVPAGCEMTQLWVDPIYLATHRNNPIAERRSVSMKDIASEKFIVNQSHFGVEIREFLIKRLSDLGVSPSVEVFDVGREVLFTMAGMGFGSTITAESGTGVAYPDVVYLPIAEVRIPFSAAWSPANPNPALRRFLSFGSKLSGSSFARRHEAF